MTHLHGQILRTTGLFIEMLGILAFAFRTGTDELGHPLPGSFAKPLVWTVIGCGFAAWLIGTLIIYGPGSGRRVRRSAAKPDAIRPLDL